MKSASRASVRDCVRKSPSARASLSSPVSGSSMPMVDGSKDWPANGFDRGTVVDGERRDVDEFIRKSAAQDYLL